MSKMKSALLSVEGHEVGRRIRAALGSRVFLVALTAYGREQDRRRLSPAGFDAHLVKPASYADLTRVLARAAGGES
jgi:CheY-like chemotaxis protein